MDKTIKIILEKIKNKEIIKLNLGVGGNKKEGFLGVDANEGPNTDIICDLIELSNQIPKESINEIYSRHVIEHFPRKKIPEIIKSWIKLLKKSGKITLNFPDLDRYVDYYVEHRDKIPVEEFARWLYGNQKDQYDIHKAGFNGEYISNILKNSGMEIQSIKPAIVGNGIPPENRSITGTEIIAIKK